MKTKYRIPILLCYACLISGHLGAADKKAAEKANTETFLVIANSPKNVMTAIAEQFQDFVGLKANPGDLLHVISAPEHNQVVSLIVPPGSKNARLRSPAVKKAIPHIKALLEAESPPDGGQVQLPMLSATIASLRRTTLPCRCVIVGTPIFFDPEQLGYSMRDGRVLTDGVLSAAHSPFNLSVKFPKGSEFTFLTPSASWGDSPAHQDEVTRFIRLFFQENRGTLVRLTPDAAAAFAFSQSQFDEPLVRRVEESGSRKVTRKSIRSSDKGADEPIIVPIQPPKASKPIQPPPSPPTVTAASPVISQPTRESSKPANELQAKSAEELLKAAEADTGFTAIAIAAISSDPNCDCDLRLSKSGVRDELYFGCKKTSFGQYFQDVQSSVTSVPSNAKLERYEWVRVEGNSVSDLTLWVNVYATTQPVKVRIIKVCKGIRTEQTVDFPISQGDHAASSLLRSLSPSWKKITL